MLQERVDYLNYVFGLLQDTNSRTEKELIIKDIDSRYREDFDFVIECLTGKHKFGYTYHKVPCVYNQHICDSTVKQVLQFLLTPAQQKDLTVVNINAYLALTSAWHDFFEPIVNRTLRLGIGNSLIEKSAIAPMLAKKFEGDIKPSKDGYFITEKLDGNRCIAYHDGIKWNFVSRNGKEMHVNFDMTGLDKKYIYDGEVLSPLQTRNSELLHDAIVLGVEPRVQSEASFNYTSGLINRHTTDKKLVYNIFDIVDNNSSYTDRRHELDGTRRELSGDIRILPILSYCKTKDDLNNIVWGLLNDVVDANAEGLMINVGSANYLNKRTDQLLKLKKVYTMDMKVIDWELGTGKYQGHVGALICEAITMEGKHIVCKVGTGLSDEQRQKWASLSNNPVGTIVEVSYFSLSQESSKRGTNEFSLRFPRLKRVRNDKSETSQY